MRETFEEKEKVEKGHVLTLEREVGVGAEAEVEIEVVVEVERGERSRMNGKILPEEAAGVQILHLCIDKLKFQFDTFISCIHSFLFERINTLGFWGFGFWGFGVLGIAE